MNIREDRPSHDSVAWLPVKLIAADGDTWNGKVEVKAHKQTVLKLAYSGKPATAAPASGKFIGKMMNLTSACPARGQSSRSRSPERDCRKYLRDPLDGARAAPRKASALHAGGFILRPAACAPVFVD